MPPITAVLGREYLPDVPHDCSAILDACLRCQAKSVIDHSDAFFRRYFFRKGWSDKAADGGDGGCVEVCVRGRGDGWLTIITTRGYRYTSPCGRAERKRGRDSDVREKVRMGCSEEWKREERVFKQIENFVTVAKSWLQQRQLSLISSISERVAQRDVWMFLTVATVHIGNQNKRNKNQLKWEKLQKVKEDSLW